MERRRKASTRADGEQYFFAQRVLDLLEIQSSFTLVAQHFENGRSALFCNFDAAIVELHDVHLQRLHLKIPRVPAIRARQRHSTSSSPCGLLRTHQHYCIRARKKHAICEDRDRALYADARS
jgi:hypothetical protein